MNIIISIDAEKRQRKNIVRILDRYATRFTNTVWHTPITQEGVFALKKELSSVVSKHSNIHIHKTTRHGVSLLYTIGNSNERYIKSLRSKINKSPELTIIPLLAKLSGLSHDLGKIFPMFQNKIRGLSVSISDAVRHEVLSTIILHRVLFDGTPTTDDKLFVISPRDINNLNVHLEDFLRRNVSYTKFFYLSPTLTHHKMIPGDFNNSGELSNINSEELVEIPDTNILNILNDIINIKNKIDGIIKKYNVTPGFMEYASRIARMSLIVADHYISAKDERNNKEFHKEYKWYANTYGKHLNQQLDWHLRNIGDTAEKISREILFRRHDYSTPDTLSDDVFNLINSGFSWQEDSISEIPGQTDPCFCILDAPTGSGKTVAYSKLALKIKESTGSMGKIIIALGLRTLTQQTFDEYKDLFPAMVNNLNMVMGGQNVKFKTDTEFNTMEEQSETYTYSSTDSCEPPEYIKKYVINKKANTYIDKIFGNLITVSTIDYIINAGDQTKQALHITSELALNDGVLILDEIDDYSPNQLIAIKRLMFSAAIMNCSVIISSATISKELVSELYKVYNSGRSGVKNNDEYIAPVLMCNENSQAFFNGGCEAMVDKYSEHHNNDVKDERRMFEIRDIISGVGGPESSFFDTIHTYINDLHGINKTKVNGCNISFGMVRFANIGVLQQFITHISALNNENIIYLPYHSRFIDKDRARIEGWLNLVMKRKRGWESKIMENPIISEITNNRKDVTIVIVASPVIEVGRDYDFDWSIMEPSSCKQIIQTFGRVKRHRSGSASDTDVIILNENYKSFVGGKDALIFSKPGFQSDGRDGRISTPTYDGLCTMRDLLGIDPGLQFNMSTNDWIGTKFWEYDVKAMSKPLREHDKHHDDRKIKEQFDIASYKNYRLRDFNYSVEVSRNHGGEYHIKNDKDKWNSCTVECDNFNGVNLVFDTRLLDMSPPGENMISLPLYSNDAVSDYMDAGWLGFKRVDT